MKDRSKKAIIAGTGLIIAFILWTFLIQCVDVQPIGQNGTNIGFATINTWFHDYTGVHLAIYVATDWIEILAFVVCICFGVVGVIQLIKRKSLLKVDRDIIFLGIYYLVVIFAYFVFEKYPVNYRPILIDGIMEASYPSSTTLLVLSVMPTLSYQVNRRSQNAVIKNMTTAFVILFSLFMVIGRTVSGVHWLTDIIGSVLLSCGLFLIYKYVCSIDNKKQSVSTQ